MYHALNILSLVLFLVMPPVLITLHAGHPKYNPWLLVILLAMVFGWILVNASVHFYFRYLDDLVRSTPQPSQDLVDRLTNDGAPQVFAWLFGWLYGFLYLSPWVAAYALLRRTRKVTLARRKNDPAR
jgi:hypothetical protein